MKSKTLRALYLAVALLAGLASIPAYGQAKPWLDVLIGRRLTVSGTPVPQRTNLELGTGMVATDDPAHDRTILTSSAGAGTGAMIVSTQSALKALSAINHTDGQLVTVKATNKTWTWAATSGAGFPGDDTTSAQLTETLTASAGRFYPADGAPVVDTIAALRAASGSIHTLVQVRSFSSLGDGGGGQFARRTGTITDDTGIEVQPTAAAFHFERVFSGPTHAEWYGVRADAIQVVDGVRTLGNARLVSAAGLFTAAMVTRKVLIREPDPASLATNTITFGGGTNNVVAQYNGSDIVTMMPPIGAAIDGYEPASGGAIFVEDTYYAAFEIFPSTQQLLLYQGFGAKTAKPWYTETQRELTVAAFVSATEITLSATAPVSQTSVLATIATDDAAAIAAAWISTRSHGGGEVVHPSNPSGIFSNIGITAMHGLAIKSKVSFVDLRKASRDYTYPNPNSYYGAISFVNSSEIRFEQPASYDANVPVLGMVHSAGGSSNNSGSRSGFVFFTCDNCYMNHPTLGRYGARDEHVYVQDGKNVLIEDADLLLTNNVSVNYNGGRTGNVVRGGRMTGFLGAADGLDVIDVEITTSNHPRAAGGITTSDVGHVRIIRPHLHDINLPVTGGSLIDCFSNADTAATLEILSPNFHNNTGLWATGQGGLIHIADHRGIVRITGIEATNNSGSTGARHVVIDGVHTGKIVIEPGHLDGGTNMTTGIEVVAGVPDGSVTIAPGGRYGSGVTTRWLLGAALGDLDTGGVL